MSAPLYFFPKLRLAELAENGTLSPSVLKRYGLDAILHDVGPVSGHCANDLTGKGPGDDSGTMFCTNTEGKIPHRAGYSPDFQRWQLVRKDPDLWIGIDNEHPPTPKDLVRPRVTDGHNVELSDGHNYRVPVIRSPMRRTGLPEDMYLDADGEFKIELKPEYQQLWDDTGVIWDFFYDDEPDEAAVLLYSDILRHCLDFVGLNYRYGRYEQSVLRLIDRTDAVWRGVLQAAVDWPMVVAEVDAKKKDTTE